MHNDRYDFNDEFIPYGSARFARLVERSLVSEPGPTRGGPIRGRETCAPRAPQRSLPAGSR